MLLGAVAGQVNENQVFGAGTFGQGGGCAVQVFASWYRPPELFFGCRSYGAAVDIFSMGLIYAELIKRVPFLAGGTDVEQINLIGRALGTPTEQNWPGVTRFDGYLVANAENPGPEADKAFYKQQFFSISPSGRELMRGMLRLDPRNRVSARKALDSDWFKQAQISTFLQNSASEQSFSLDPYHLHPCSHPVPLVSSNPSLPSPAPPYPS